MKKVGIIGGLSPESTMLYYAGINDGVRVHMGGLHSGTILLNSLDFGVFVALKNKGDWDTQAEILCDAARSLERAGADFIILATNTMHKMADQIEAEINIPFLHLADATARRIKDAGMDRIALLGTRYTMEQNFYKERLERIGIEVLVPDTVGRQDVHDIIYDELCNGTVLQSSKEKYQDIIGTLQKQGAQGVVLGCTEITMLMKTADIEIKCFDTTAIHIEETLTYMLEGE